MADTQTKPEMGEIATIALDQHRVTYGGNVLRNEDDTLLTRGRGKGLKIYEDLKRDGEAGAVLRKRVTGVTSRPWEIKPASDRRDDKKAAELVRNALEALKFRRMCKGLLDATLKGYAVAEVLWEVRDGLVLPRDVVGRDQRRFVFDVNSQLRLLTREATAEGIELPGRKFIVHRHGAEDGDPYGKGLGSSLFWPVFFKRQDITFWLTFADKFGAPTAVGKYPSSATKPEQEKLLQALSAIAHDSGVTIPEGMVIELVEAKRSGALDTYEKLARYMDEQINKIVLGETMSTTAQAAGMGSGQADVHNDVRLELAEDDAHELDETLKDTLITWIVEVNMPGAGIPKLCHQFEAPEDLAKRATRDKTLVDMGWEPDEEYILETYGEGWTKKAAQVPVTAPVNPAQSGQGIGQNNAADPATQEGQDNKPSFAEHAATRGQREQLLAEQEAMAQAATALAGNWQQLMRKRVDDLRTMLDNTGDLVAFREGMDKLLEEDPPAEVVQAVAQATFAAHIVGRGKAEPKAGPLKRLAARAGALVRGR